MNKKIIIISIFALVAFFLVTLLISLNDTSPDSEAGQSLKRHACYVADSAGTCDSIEASLISRDECCRLYSKCCI